MNRKHMIVLGSFVIAFGVVSFMGWKLLIQPVDKKIKAKRAEVDEVDKKLKDAKSKAAQYDKFKAQAENIRRDLTLISQRLDSDFSLREVNRMASRFYAGSNLKVESVLLGKREKSKEPGFANLDNALFVITFKGGFHEIGEYFNAAVSGNRMVVPTILDFKVGEEFLRAPTVSGTFTMGVFLETAGAK